MAGRKDLTDALDGGLLTLQANLHTILVGRVESVGLATVDVQPCVAREVDGVAVQLPLFPEVPVVCLSGGPSALTFPIAPGDYCLLLVTERALDQWYAGTDGVVPADARMHDYSDCFALVGVRPLASQRAIPEDATLTGVVRLGAAAPTDAVAVGSRVLAELQALRSTVNAMVTAFNSHVHTGVSTGGGSSGAPASSQVAPAVVGAVSSTFVKIPGGVA